MRSLKSFLIDLEDYDLLKQDTKYIIGTAICFNELDRIFGFSHLDNLSSTNHLMIKHYQSLAKIELELLNFEQDDEYSWGVEDEYYRHAKHKNDNLLELQTKLDAFTAQVNGLNNLIKSIQNNLILMTELSIMGSMRQIMMASELKETYSEIKYFVQEANLETDMLEYHNDLIKDIIYTYLGVLSEMRSGGTIYSKDYPYIELFLKEAMVHFDFEINGVENDESTLTELLQMALEPPYYLSSPKGGTANDESTFQ